MESNHAQNRKSGRAFIAFSALSLKSLVLLVSASGVRAEGMTAWSAPQWGFVAPVAAPVASPHVVLDHSTLSKSLVFDQSFDTVSVNPFPGRAPAPIAETKTFASRVAVAASKAPGASLSRTLQTFAATPVSRSPEKSLGLESSLGEATEALKRNLAPRGAAPAEIPGVRVASSITSQSEPLLPANEVSLPEWASAALNNKTQAPKVQRSDADTVAWLADQVKVTNPSSLKIEAITEVTARSTSPTIVGSVVVKNSAPAVPAQQTPHQTVAKFPGATKTDAPKTTPPANAGATVVASNSTLSDASRKGAALVTSYSQESPAPESNAAKIFVIDEDSLTQGSVHGVEGATVTWFGPNSGIVKKTNTKGVARAPYPASAAVRFVVQAPGYLPALGYAIEGLVSKVVLMSERKLAPVIKSLGVAPDPQKTLVFGKILNKKGRPVEGMTLEASIEKPFKLFYSIGGFGVFHPKAVETGSQGDFFISGVASGIQYLMPSQNISSKSAAEQKDPLEWPASILDFTGVGPVVSVTLQESTGHTVTTQVVDAFSMERPSGVGIQATVGGQRGVFVPDAEGKLEIGNMHKRDNPDLVEIHAQGYLKTWITGVPDEKHFPELIALFTQRQLDTVLQEAAPEIELNGGIVLGNLRAEKFKKSMVVSVYGPTGLRAGKARVLYFDDRNIARLKLTQTDNVLQNFAVANLDAGEWHVVVSEATTGKTIGTQIVRTEGGTVTQVQF